MNEYDQKKVCVVIGVGPGSGAALAKRFAKEGYAVALLARSTELTASLASTLPDARACPCDASDVASVTDALDAIARYMGPAHTIQYNAGSGSWATFEELAPSALENAFRVNAIGLLVAAQTALQAMKQGGGGNIVVIGATASRRGCPRPRALLPRRQRKRASHRRWPASCGPWGFTWPS